ASSRRDFSTRRRPALSGYGRELCGQSAAGETGERSELALVGVEGTRSRQASGGRHAPGWSPAANEQRTHAAWSSRPQPAPTPTAPRLKLRMSRKQETRE